MAVGVDDNDSGLQAKKERGWMIRAKG